MRSRKKILLSIMIVLAATLFAVVFVHSALYMPDSQIIIPSDNQDQIPINNITGMARNAVETIQKPLPGSHPARLQIPKLKIDAKVQEVGITKAGNMGIPNNFKDVAWYKYGTIPGEKGSAVIDGHVDNGLALPGVFKHLNTLSVGDDVFIVSNDGTKLHFVVSKVETIKKNASTEEIFNQKGEATIRLITCTGDWIAKEKTYSDRIVVTATLAP